MLNVHYYLNGREILIDAGEAPRVGDEVGFDGQAFGVVRVVWHRPMCPPDRVHVHLRISECEAITGPGRL